MCSKEKKVVVVDSNSIKFLLNEKEQAEFWSILEDVIDNALEEQLSQNK